MTYRERLHAPLLAHVLPVLFGVPLLLSGTVSGGASSDLSGFPRAAAVGLGVLALVGGEALLLLAGRRTVTVTGGRLRAGPLDAAAAALDARDVDSTQLRALMRDPTVRRVTSAWVRTAVQVITPAGERWVVSTRRPQRLVAALEAT